MDQQFSGEGPTDNEVSAEECLTDNEEMKKAENISSIYSIEVKEYSTFNKLIRTTAWANSFINNLKSKIKNKYIHKKTISRRSGMGRSNKDISKLNIKWDENWILLCYRRLTPARKEANITPIYLPKKNHVARLLIKDHHQRLFHAGASHTLSYVMFCTIWLPSLQFKKREKHPWRSATLSKIAGFYVGSQFSLKEHSWVLLIHF